MSKTITVTGKSKVSITPDTLRIKIDLEATEKDYDTCITTWLKQVKSIQECLKQVGINEKDIKTGRFNIDPERERYETFDKAYRYRLVGFKYEQSLFVEFSIDNALLAKVIYQLAHNDCHPEFSIQYFVKDDTKAKEELLRSCIQDSKQKATLLCETSGVVLGDILTINYSWNELEIVSREQYDFNIGSYADCDCMAVPDYEVDVNPNDIDLSDSVTVVWEIQ